MRRATNLVGHRAHVRILDDLRQQSQVSVAQKENRRPRDSPSPEEINFPRKERKVLASYQS